MAHKAFAINFGRMYCAMVFCKEKPSLEYFKGNISIKYRLNQVKKDRPH